MLFRPSCEPCRRGADTLAHWLLPFTLPPLSQCALHGAGSAGGLMHRRRGSLIAADSTQIAHVYLPGKASELFSWFAFNFFFFSFFFFFFLFLALPASEGPCGMDAMRWSTEKAIYPPFVLLRSFKKANSLKALERRGVGGGRRQGEDRPTASWALHQVDRAD